MPPKTGSRHSFCLGVRDAAGLRLLQHDGEGLRAVAELRGDEYLHAWECGYDDDGCWDDARAASGRISPQQTDHDKHRLLRINANI